MKDGKCWSKTEVATSVYQSAAVSKCTGVWHLPTQDEFDILIRSYCNIPSAKNNYCSDADAVKNFLDDWGSPIPSSQGYWSSTTYYASGQYMNCTAAHTATYSYTDYSKSMGVNSAECITRTPYNVRCVSN